MEASKSKLADLTVEHERDGIRVICNGNRVVMDIDISPDLLQADRKEELEDVLIAVINEAMAKADEDSSKAMKDMAGKIMPGGLDGLF